MTEATSARVVFETKDRYFSNRITKVNASFEETRIWLEQVRNETRNNSDRIVDRQIYLKQAPQLQARIRAKIARLSARITAHIAKRNETNIRFHIRRQRAYETLAGSEHVKSFLNPATLANRVSNLKDTLNVHHDPAVQRAAGAAPRRCSTAPTPLATFTHPLAPPAVRGHVDDSRLCHR